MPTMSLEKIPIDQLVALSKLPTFSPVAVRLVQLVSQEDASFAEISRLLATDAALSAEVLRVANSPLFGTRCEIKSIASALTTVGMDRLSLLVCTTALWRCIPGSVSHQVVHNWWRHNLASAFICQHLCGSGPDRNYSYAAALLHSTGQLALIGAYPVEYINLLSRAATEGHSLMDYEVEHLGVDHCTLGEALLNNWHLPPELADSAAHHHDPENARFPLTRMVHVSCVVATHIGFSVAGMARPAELDDLPEAAVRVIEDEPLCIEIAEKINSIESRLL